MKHTARLFLLLIVSLVAIPEISGQKTGEITSTVVADSTYGVGGTLETKSVGKWRTIEEVWRDKDKNNRQYHILEYTDGQLRREIWGFFGADKKGREYTFNYNLGNLLVTTGYGGKKIHEVIIRLKRQPEEWIEIIRKQYIESGTFATPYLDDKKDDPPKTNTFTPLGQPVIDGCLIGKWKATKVEMSSRYTSFKGGTGFSVTISKDGTQAIDYTSMASLVNIANESYTFSGTATGKITTDNGVAKIESIERSGVKVSIVTVNDPSISYILKNLGPGALGSTANTNNFTCTNDTLEYFASWTPSGQPNFHVVLTRSK